MIGVRVLRVDEHVRKHTHRPGEPSSFVTVLVDLTPSIDRTGQSDYWTWCQVEALTCCAAGSRFGTQDFVPRWR